MGAGAALLVSPPRPGGLTKGLCEQMGQGGQRVTSWPVNDPRQQGRAGWSVLGRNRQVFLRGTRSRVARITEFWNNLCWKSQRCGFLLPPNGERLRLWSGIEEGLRILPPPVPG